MYLTIIPSYMPIHTLSVAQTQNILYLYTMAKSTRNKNAGKFTGKSESSKYFATHPEARAKKNAYNKAYHATPERKKYRQELNKINRRNNDSGYGDNKDLSHTVSGKLVTESRSRNRARNGKNGKRSRL